VAAVAATAAVETVAVVAVATQKIVTEAAAAVGKL